MVNTAEPEITVQYEGPGAGTEIWGMTQANFIVGRHGRAAQEVAVMLSNPAAELLAEAIGQECTPEFRIEAARNVGAIWTRQVFAAHGRVDPTVTVSRGTFEEHPELLAQVKAAVRGRG
ncbi:MAG TPA: hypothetical protein VIH05_10455 [Tepidiformaceae bacterium]